MDKRKKNVLGRVSIMNREAQWCESPWNFSENMEKDRAVKRM